MTQESPLAVANYFIEKSVKEGRPVTPMKLLKLVYIAHGWHLGLTGEPLFSESVQAWKFGPVITSIYHTFKHYGNSSLPLAARAEGVELNDPDRIRPLLDRVWDVYGKYTGGQLSTITHMPETPWSKSYQAGERGIVISPEVIRDHYKQKADAKRARAAAAAPAN